MPNFLTKTYEIVNDAQNSDIVFWNETGDGFIVKNSNQFAENVLPQYFKHNNFSSFVRQLNMYDFHKSRNAQNWECFTHPCFRKGSKPLLAKIRRKNANPKTDNDGTYMHNKPQRHQAPMKPPQPRLMLANEPAQQWLP